MLFFGTLRSFTCTFCYRFKFTYLHRVFMIILKFIQVYYLFLVLIYFFLWLVRNFFTFFIVLAFLISTFPKFTLSLPLLFSWLHSNCNVFYNISFAFFLLNILYSLIYNAFLHFVILFFSFFVLSRSIFFILELYAIVIVAFKLYIIEQGNMIWS